MESYNGDTTAAAIVAGTSGVIVAAGAALLLSSPMSSIDTVTRQEIVACANVLSDQPTEASITYEPNQPSVVSPNEYGVCLEDPTISRQFRKVVPTAASSSIDLPTASPKESTRIYTYSFPSKADFVAGNTHTVEESRYERRKNIAITAGLAGLFAAGVCYAAISGPKRRSH